MSNDGSQKHVRRFLGITLPFLETTFTKNADEYLGAAHGCSAKANRARFRACTQSAIAGTEMMDGPQMRDPLAASRTAEQDLGDVFTGILDGNLVAGSCRAAITAYEDGAVNAYDRVILKVESAAARGRFSLISSLSTPARISALDASAAAADRVWHRACET